MEKPELERQDMTKGILAKGLAGAGTGVAVGSAVGGPVGTAIGAVGGFAVGAIIGGMEVKTIFKDQMDLYNVSKKQKKEQDKFALATKRESDREAKRAGSISPITPAPVVMDAMGATASSPVTSYDQYMNNLSGFGS